MKKTFWAMALAAALTGAQGAAAADYIAAAPPQRAAGQSMGFVFQQMRPCAEESGYSLPEEDFSVLYLDRAPEADNEDMADFACRNRAGLAAAAGKARLTLGPDKNAPLAGSAAAEARG